MSDFTASVLSQSGLFDFGLSSAIDVNGLLVSPKYLCKAVLRFSGSLVQTTDPETSFNLLGSCALVTLGGRCLAISTAHQLSDVPAEDFYLSVDHLMHFASSGSYRFVGRSNDREVMEQDDIGVFDFSNAAKHRVLAASQFFDLHLNSCIQPGERVVCGVAYGYAFSDHRVELSDELDLPVETKSDASIGKWFANISASQMVISFLDGTGSQFWGSMLMGSVGARFLRSTVSPTRIH